MITALSLVIALALAGPPQAVPTAPAELPPVSWTCPMHADVLEDGKGVCPICGMELVPTRVDLAFTCMLHGMVMESGPGACPICRRPLVQVTVALTFTCPTHAEVDATDPGTCPIDGQALVPKRTARAHGDHNPRHGGLFFMASDNSHHLEGTYPEAGLFRLYLYNDYTKPIGAAGATGRAVLDEQFNPDTRQTLEKNAVPLAVSPDGRTLEAHVGSLPLPARIVAKLKFDPDGPEHRFDFLFPAYSVEPDDPGATTAAPVLQPLDAMPEDPPEILAALEARRGRLEELIARGVLNEVYIPALEAKDLALLLQERSAGVPASRRLAFDLAIRGVVQAAWLLDSYGDLGDRQKVAAAFETFARALAQVTASINGR